MKPSRATHLSPLGKYLWENRISDNAFAVMMKAHLKVDKFSSSTVENWRYGATQPKNANLSACCALTGLTAGQILGTETVS